MAQFNLSFEISDDFVTKNGVEETHSLLRDVIMDLITTNYSAVSEDTNILDSVIRVKKVKK